MIIICPMRTAIFTNNYLPRVSGVSVAVSFLRTALQRLGHETIIVAPDYGPGKDEVDDNVYRVTSIRILTNKFSVPVRFFDTFQVRDELERFKPSLIHVHHPFILGKMGLDLAEHLKLPLVYTFHTLYDFFMHYFMLDTAAIRQAANDYVVRFANLCDLVIAPTEPIKEHLRNIGVESWVESVPTGIDFTRFEGMTEDRLHAQRKKLGLDKFDEVMLYVGRIAKEKNVETMFEALRILLARGRNIALVIAGEGPERRPLTRVAEKMKIDDNVIWTGFLSQKELPELYFVADLFCFPSPSDTQGIVLYEALMAGLPIVALESMASRAAVRHGENGLFAENSAQDFADKIAEVLDNRDRYTTRFDPAPFSYESIGKRYEDLYGAVLEKGRKPINDKSILKMIFFQEREGKGTPL